MIRMQQGCHHQDLTDPLGNEGIDNAMSGLVPALELYGSSCNRAFDR